MRDRKSDEAIRLVCEMANDLRRQEFEIGELKEKLDAPLDEKLRQAHLKIKQLEREIKGNRRKSLYVMRDEDIKREFEITQAHAETGCKNRNGCYELSFDDMGISVSFLCKKCGFTEEIVGEENW